MTPEFIIIGAPKAGTTSMWRLLSQHPEIFPCARKEPGFFKNDELYARGWDSYQTLFAGKSSGQIAGEATTQYSLTTSFPHTVSRIAHHLPDAKLIFMMRHPYAILESWWRETLFHRMSVPRDFTRALQDYPPLIENALFGTTISDYLECFSERQIFPILMDEFSADPSGICKRLFGFLGVDPVFEVSEPRVISNPGTEKDMDTWLVSTLRRFAWTGRVRDVLPMRLRLRLRSVTRQSPPAPTWSIESLKRVREQIEEDVISALEFAGKPSDYWDLSDRWLERTDNVEDQQSTTRSESTD